jgi:hypothetical protein
MNTKGVNFRGECKQIYKNKGGADMECPNCKTSMSRQGQPHYEANGDVYSYDWCHRCEKSFEVVEDALFGGKPTITEQ